MIILQALAFFLFVLTIFYIPGFSILRLGGIKLKGIPNAATSITAGIIFFIVWVYCLRFFGLGFELIVAPIVLFSFFRLRQFLKDGFRWSSLLKKEYGIFLTLAVVFAFLQGSMVMDSGVMTKDGVVFGIGTHDPLYHFSLINELRVHFPPQNPSFSPEPLKNYHFFTDLVMAAVLETLPLKLYDFYFRIFPVFISLLFSASVYSLASELTKRLWVRFFAMILVAIGGTAAYLQPLFQKNVDWNALTFFVDQPFSQIFNPQNYIGYSFFFIGAFYVFYFVKSKVSFSLIASGVVLGMAFPIKVYASVIGLAALAATGVYRLLFKKDIKYIGSFFIGAVIFGSLTLLIINSYQTGIHFLPGWGLRQMIESTDRLNLVDWILKLEHYKATGNYIRQVQIYLQEILLFIFGNLGIRAIGFFYLIYLFLKNPFSQTPGLVFLASATGASLTIPMLFIQGGSPYDIFQFAHYGLMVSALLSAIAWERLSEFYKFKKSLIVVGCLVILAFALPTTIKAFYWNITDDKKLIDQGTLEYLGFAKSTNNDSVFLVYPDAEGARYTVGIAGRRVYISDLGITIYAKGDKKQRERDAQNFFDQYTDLQRAEFIRNNHINYITVPTHAQSLLINPERIQQKIVFKNEKYIVVEVQ